MSTSVVENWNTDALIDFCRSPGLMMTTLKYFAGKKLMVLPSLS
jgi:hypothetical protein